MSLQLPPLAAFPAISASHFGNSSRDDQRTPVPVDVSGLGRSGGGHHAAARRGSMPGPHRTPSYIVKTIIVPILLLEPG